MSTKISLLRVFYIQESFYIHVQELAQIVCLMFSQYSQMDMVYGLLSMLGTHDKDDMSKTFLAMSNSPDSCVAMRQSGK